MVAFSTRLTWHGALPLPNQLDQSQGRDSRPEESGGTGRPCASSSEHRVPWFLKVTGTGCQGVVRKGQQEPQVCV